MVINFTTRQPCCLPFSVASNGIGNIRERHDSCVPLPSSPLPSTGPSLPALRPSSLEGYLQDFYSPSTASNACGNSPSLGTMSSMKALPCFLHQGILALMEHITYRHHLGGSRIVVSFFEEGNRVRRNWVEIAPAYSSWWRFGICTSAQRNKRQQCGLPSKPSDRE